MDLQSLVDRIAPGWQRVSFDGHPYGLLRRDHVDGRVVTLLAEQLDGNDVVSANVWRRSTGTDLRPCEMPAQKVLEFLSGWS